MKLRYRARKMEKGYNDIINAKNSTLKLIEFGRLFFPDKGGKYGGESNNKELVLTILSGKCSIKLKNDPTGLFEYNSLGGRKDVFSGKPTMVYIPGNTEYIVESESEKVDIGIFRAPANKNTPPTLIKPQDVVHSSRGANNWRRDVYAGIGSNIEAERLLVGETINPPGNWSGMPAHKHDELNLPYEVPFEEIYFFIIKPSDGFGMLRLYTSLDDNDPFDEAIVVENGDAVCLPRGYHPVCVVPGFQLYYLWGLSGVHRQHSNACAVDPTQIWLNNCEPIVKEMQRQ